MIYNKIYETANDIPITLINNNKYINGVVVKVSDGDTVRLRHTTFFKKSPLFKGKLTDHTIPIRIAAVDTPETAKYGNKGQAFAIEAKDFTTKKLLGQHVQVQLLSKDQYSRIVGLIKYNDNIILRNIPVINKYSTKDISEELLKEGLAVVYRQGGAQYGSNKDVNYWNKLEQQSKSKKKGLWYKGTNEVELPSQYKKNIKNNNKLQPSNAY